MAEVSGARSSSVEHSFAAAADVWEGIVVEEMNLCSASSDSGQTDLELEHLEERRLFASAVDSSGSGMSVEMRAHYHS